MSRVPVFEKGMLDCSRAAVIEVDQEHHAERRPDNFAIGHEDYLKKLKAGWTGK